MTNPEIGSKYDGPCFDKPCIRQMPKHWVLEESRLPRPWRSRPEVWICLLFVGWLMLAAINWRLH